MAKRIRYNKWMNWRMRNIERQLKQIASKMGVIDLRQSFQVQRELKDREKRMVPSTRPWRKFGR